MAPPIPQEDINTNWVWVSSNEPVGQLQAKLSADRKVRAYQYIVFATNAGTYVVARWYEIEQIGRKLKRRDTGAANAALSLYWNFLTSQRQANSPTNAGGIPKTGSRWK